MSLLQRHYFGDAFRYMSAFLLFSVYRLNFVIYYQRLVRSKAQFEVPWELQRKIDLIPWSRSQTAPWIHFPVMLEHCLKTQKYSPMRPSTMVRPPKASNCVTSLCYFDARRALQPCNACIFSSFGRILTSNSFLEMSINMATAPHALAGTES
jgi:hypothetical protein